MSNIDEATLVIADVIESEGGNPALHIDLGYMTDVIAQGLARAGLLAPNLPEPDLDHRRPAYCAIRRKWWGEGPVPDVWFEGLPYDLTVQIFPDRPEVQMTDNEEPMMEPFSPEEARRLAHALLAAANHAEGEA